MFIHRMLIKRAQGRRKFGRKNFKQRYFTLTNESLSYSKFKGGQPLCSIPIEDILAVETLLEQSFKMKYVRFLFSVPDKLNCICLLLYPPQNKCFLGYTGITLSNGPGVIGKSNCNRL